MTKNMNSEKKENYWSDRMAICFIMLVGIILWPLTSGISIFVALLLLFCVACILGSEQVSSNDEIDPSQIKRQEESDRADIEIDDNLLMDRYIFPSKCPQCQIELNLDEIEWVEANSALCPNCEFLIRAEKI